MRVDSVPCAVVSMLLQDATLVLERPKILPYKQAMRERMAEICGLPIERVSLKATTSESIGFVGRREGVQAYCICEVQPA